MRPEGFIWVYLPLLSSAVVFDYAIKNVFYIFILFSLFFSKLNYTLHITQKNAHALAYIKKKLYLRPTPPCFQQGPLRMLHSHFAAYSKHMSVFLPVLCTLYIVPLYFGYMPHYASICCLSPYTIHRITFYLAKKHLFSCVYAKIVVNLHPI